jgi:hypothetical protein
MAIWELGPNSVKPLEAVTFSGIGVRERQDLQRLLRQNISVISPETLVIAEEFGDWSESRRRIDLLGVARDAGLVVIELKRSEDGGYMELQAVRYAAMVSVMTFSKAVEIYEQYLRSQNREGEAEDLILEFLDWEEPREEDFANDVSIVLASAEFSRELTTSVLWLNDQGLDIRCVRLKPYRLGETILLDVQQVLPLPEAESYQVQLRNKVEEQRRARSTSERDLTRYDLRVSGRQLDALPKRWLAYHVVRAAFDSGATPEDLMPLMPRGHSRFVSVEGECTEQEFLSKLAALRKPRGGEYDPRRYSTGDTELFRIRGRTYALSNQWGSGNALLAVRGIADAYPQLGVTFEATSEGSQPDHEEEDDE